MAQLGKKVGGVFLAVQLSSSDFVFHQQKRLLLVDDFDAVLGPVVFFEVVVALNFHVVDLRVKVHVEDPVERRIVVVGHDDSVD